MVTALKTAKSFISSSRQYMDWYRYKELFSSLHSKENSYSSSTTSMTFFQAVLYTSTKYGAQSAFALAPIPAYLPQYWTLCESSDDPILKGKVPKIAESMKNKNSNIEYNNNDGLTIMSGEGDSLNRVSSSNTRSTSNGGCGDGGFSSLSILILLLSHLFRLIYFYGCATVTVEKDRPFDTSSNHDTIQYDLVMQSFTMMAVQILLLSAMVRRRKVTAKKHLVFTSPRPSPPSQSQSKSIRGRRTNISHFQNEASSPPRSGTLSMEENFQTPIPKNNSSINFSNDKYASTSELSPTFLSWLSDPSQYWKWHHLRPHIEFLALISISTLIFCHTFLFLRYADVGVRMIRNISVVLESCLALPQLLQNYHRRDTSGLSLVMVTGWVSGDFMKLVYFLCLASRQQQEQPNNLIVGTVVPELAPLAEDAVMVAKGSEMGIFAWGCVLALTLDILVAVQIFLWFPTREIAQIKGNITRGWRRFVTERGRSSS